MGANAGFIGYLLLYGNPVTGLAALGGTVFGMGGQALCYLEGQKQAEEVQNIIERGKSFEQRTGLYEVPGGNRYTKRLAGEP